MKIVSTDNATTEKLKKGAAGMSNERYRDFLKFALKRIVEVATLYEGEAKSCKDPANKLFLYYLAGKKRVQYVLLEMIASSPDNNSEAVLVPVVAPESTHEKFSCDLSTATADAIVRFAKARAEKDLNLYVSLAALEEDIQTKKLLVTLSKLARDFINDTNTGYANFSEKKFRNELSEKKSNVTPKLESVY